MPVSRARASPPSPRRYFAAHAAYRRLSENWIRRDVPRLPGDNYRARSSSRHPIGRNSSHRALLRFVPTVAGTHLLTQTPALPPFSPRRDHPRQPRGAQAVQGEEWQGNGPARENRVPPGIAAGRPGDHSFPSGPGAGKSACATMARARDSARISRTRCCTNQMINARTPRMIGMSNGRVTSLISS